MKTQTKKKKGKGGGEGGRQKKNREFCSVSPIKSIHPDEGFNGANPLLESKRNSPLWLSHDGGRRESRNERGADLSPRFSCLVPFMCALPPPPPPSLPLALPQFPLKCQMQQLSGSERGVPWWERAALLTWRPRLFSSPFLVFPIPLSQQMLCGCKGMSFFSPGHVNGLAQKHALILSGSGNSLHRKRLFLRAVFFYSFFPFFFSFFFFLFLRRR